jgi:5-methylcytosine-specific restriction endonuclease McrA
LAKLTEEQRSEKRERRTASGASKRYYARNSERHRALTAQWKTENPERNKAISQARRAREQNADGAFTAEEYAEVLRRQKYRCAYCRADLRKTGDHADHVVALSKGGTNHISNIQACCPACNLKKHASDPVKFAQSLGRLL